MRAYLDTNVYRFLTAAGEVAQAREYLASEGVHVLASEANLFETYAIPDHTTRLSEVRAICRIASSFEKYPDSWHHAVEVRHEIGRCRNQWLNRQPSTKKIKAFLKAHRQRWQDAQEGLVPEPESYNVFRRDFESGVARHLRVQREKRRLGVEGQPDSRAIIHTPSGTAVPVNLDEPETAWRVNAFFSWTNALVGHHPASRDYRDWLEPYLKPRVLEHFSFLTFWLEDVAVENVPKNRLIGLADFYQREHKVTHGNAVDQLHAGYLADVDLFVTADRAFSQVLKETAQTAGSSCQVLLVDRGASSALAQIDGAL